ncbi:MAG: hypothetical protein WC428_06600 [Candidatus Paceibacterota bacterium]
MINRDNFYDPEKKIDVGEQIQYCLDKFVENKDKIDNDAEIFHNLTYGEVGRALVNAGMEIAKLRIEKHDKQL